MPFIQVLHVNGNHWVTVSNIRPKSDLTYPGSVGIYDSNWSPASKSSLKTMQQICSFFKSRSPSIHFDYVNVDRQNNGADCGVFALAFATELAYKKDPSVCIWDVDDMRKHIIKSVENGCVLPFPKQGDRKIGFGRRVAVSHEESIYCLCGMPNDGTKYIECIQCLQWFHVKCVSLNTKKSFKKMTWICSECKDFNDRMTKK